MKTVTELAREAGIKNDCDGVWCTADQLQRFHDLAIAQYREGLLAGVGDAKGDLTRAINTYAMLTACATPQETKDAERKLSDVLDKQLAAAVAVERENVFSLVNKYSKANMENDNVVALLDHLAAAIRNTK